MILLHSFNSNHLSKIFYQLCTLCKTLCFSTMRRAEARRDFQDDPYPEPLENLVFSHTPGSNRPLIGQMDKMNDKMMKLLIPANCFWKKWFHSFTPWIWFMIITLESNCSEWFYLFNFLLIFFCIFAFNFYIDIFYTIIIF